MKLLSIFIILITFLFSTSSSVSGPIIESEEPKQILNAGVIIMSCNNIESIKKIAEGDKVSTALAKSFLHREIIKGKCGFYSPPFLVSLEKRIDLYKDYSNTLTGIWKLAGANLWSILQEEKILKKPKGLSV